MKAEFLQNPSKKSVIINPNFQRDSKNFEQVYDPLSMGSKGIRGTVPRFESLHKLKKNDILLSLFLFSFYLAFDLSVKMILTYDILLQTISKTDLKLAIKLPRR